MRVVRVGLYEKCVSCRLKIQYCSTEQCGHVCVCLVCDEKPRTGRSLKKY